MLVTLVCIFSLKFTFLLLILERCREFLETFPIQSEEKKYLNVLQNIAKGEQQILAIELDDIQAVSFFPSSQRNIVFLLHSYTYNYLLL